MYHGLIMVLFHVFLCNMGEATCFFIGNLVRFFEHFYGHFLLQTRKVDIVTGIRSKFQPQKVGDFSGNLKEFQSEKQMASLYNIIKIYHLRCLKTSRNIYYTGPPPYILDR